MWNLHKTDPDNPIDRAQQGRVFVEVGYQGERNDDALDLLAAREGTGTIAKPVVIEIPFEITEGGKRKIAVRERQHNDRSAGTSRMLEAYRLTGTGVPARIWIDWIEWEGPIVDEWPPSSHVELLGDNDPDTRDIIQRFAERAFRGKPVQAEYIESLVGLYQTKRDEGESFEVAIKTPLSVVLASPSFLYLSEPVTRPPETSENKELPDSESQTTQVTPIELASRLSYFLWSGPPDAELLELATSGELTKPAVLAPQVNRMLADERAREFISGFTHQWLHMERLDFFQFNYRLYSEFDDSVKAAARQEVYETILMMLRRNRPVGELLKSDTVVINDLLADFYGFDGVRGPQFREVKVPTDQPRGGLLGMAAILAMGSDGERSSPVERGAWVMRTLLHDPPPPAPANVPQLSRHAGKLLSARELLTAHMEEPQCYQCHRKIDPIGFGLEHFDAVGKWRETEYTEIAVNNRVRKSKEHPIDATGQLPDGTQFDGFFELRDSVADREEAFARGLIEHLIEYALGRPFGFSDKELAESILATSKQQQLTMRSMIHAIVQSEAFGRKQ